LVFIYFFSFYAYEYTVAPFRRTREGIRSHYRWLWATMWLLGIELRTSGRTVSAFFFFFLFFFSELGTEPRALRFLGKRSTTELNPQPLMYLFKKKKKDWRDGSVVKSTDCSSWGPEFKSQQPHGGSQPSVMGSDALFWCVWRQLQCTHINKNKLKNKKDHFPVPLRSTSG